MSLTDDTRDRNPHRDAAPDGAEATQSAQRRRRRRRPRRPSGEGQTSETQQAQNQNQQRNQGKAANADADGPRQQQRQRQQTEQAASDGSPSVERTGNRRRRRGGRGKGGASDTATTSASPHADQPAPHADQPTQRAGEQRQRRPNRRPRREDEAQERIEPERQPHPRTRGGRADGNQPGGGQPGGGRTGSSQPGRGQSAGGQAGGGDRQRRPAGPTAGDRLRFVGTQKYGAVPGPIGKDKLRVIPLGGVGEVGKNMTAVECGNAFVLLDCGGKFPEEDQQGIDLIIPDVAYVKERIKQFRGILLTHGHEDHIGGLPYIIPQLYGGKGSPKIPIWGTPLAIGFVERKLLEARVEDMVELKVVESGDTVDLGDGMSAEFIHVTHSIPDATAIAVHTPVGTIVDTGDFKFDPTPVMGDPTDERALRRLGEKGVLALFSDTVRVETEGRTPSERVVQETMEDVIAHAKGQVIIASFASNVSRVTMALRAAEKHGRKVAVAGRSMEQNTRVALELGYLDPPDGLLVSLDEVLRQPKHKRVIVSTGSQGEPGAALARIAAGEHPKIRIGVGDIILVSATPIPGNEDTVSSTIDNLFRHGAEVVYSGIDRGVHVSGHGARDELRHMIQLLKPTWTVPIHGEYRHMALYRELCVATNIPRDHVLLPEIGGVIEFTKSSANQRGRVPSGNVLVDKLGERDGSAVLRTKENLGDEGFVVVTMVVNRADGELIAGPDIVAHHLTKELNNGALREAERELKRSLTRRRKGSPQNGYVAQRAKESVARTLYRRSRSRPLILPLITEL